MLFGREFALIIRNRRAYFFFFYFRYIWRMVSEIKTMLYRFLCIFTICAFTSEKSIKTHNSDFCSVLFCEYNLIKLDPFSFFIPFTSPSWKCSEVHTWFVWMGTNSCIHWSETSYYNVTFFFTMRTHFSRFFFLA